MVLVEHVPVPVPPELDPLLLAHPPELLPAPLLDPDCTQALSQLCVSHVATAWALVPHTPVICGSQVVALHASYVPPGQTQSTYAEQSLSNVPSSEPHEPWRHDQQVGFIAVARHEPPLLLPTPLLLPIPPLLLPPPELPVHASRLKPLHSLAHALHEAKPEVAELHAGEICEAHACALQPSYDPLEHMQSTNGAHALSKVLSDDAQLFWTHA